MKKIGKLAIILAMCIGISGCKNNSNSTATKSSSNELTTISKSPDDSTRVFTDSAGREVEVPKTITKIAPSGTLAQMVLYTSSPELFVGLATQFPETSKGLFPAKYLDLPEFGQFYGKNANLNMEALSAAQPQVVIDIGEKKETVKEDMDKLQNQLEIPVVFIEANLQTMNETYEKLTELLGNKENNKQLADYCKKVITNATAAKEKIGKNEVSVYYAGGTAGLNTNAEGSFHAQVLDQVGAKNCVTGVEVNSKGEGTTISMEQLMQWQPGVIITPTEEVYHLIKSDDTWKHLDAVKNGKVYLIPTIPYNFLGAPPSINQMIGIQWLGNLLYPDEYNFDIKKEVSEFYQKFYHIELTSKQLDEILNKTK